MYHDDAVPEFPQSGERFVGVDNFREWRRDYPASTSFEIHRARGRDDPWVVEGSIAYDESPPRAAITILELRGDKIAHESVYVAELPTTRGSTLWEPS